MLPQASKCQQPPETGRSKEPPGGAGSANIFIITQWCWFGMLISVIWTGKRIHFCCVKSPTLWSVDTPGNNRKSINPPYFLSVSYYWTSLLNNNNNNIILTQDYTPPPDTYLLCDRPPLITYACCVPPSSSHHHVSGVRISTAQKRKQWPFVTWPSNDRFVIRTQKTDSTVVSSPTTILPHCPCTSLYHKEQNFGSTKRQRQVYCMKFMGHP